MLFGLRRRRPNTTLSSQGQPDSRPVATLEVEGRRYLSDAEATYTLPKDIADVPRLDFQHFLLRQIMRGIYIAPIPASASTILDVGCGTGRWCCDMAHAFPRAQVIGIDLEDVSSDVIQRPANYLFKQADALNVLPFAENSFDFVHLRLMLLSIPASKWTGVLHEILRIARSGGWIELVEVGCTIWPQGPVTQKWYGWIREICQRYEQDPDLPAHLRILAVQAGLASAREFPYDIPIGQWAGHLGITSLANMRGFYEAMRARNIKQIGIDPGEINQTWAELVNEWESMKAHIRYYVVCGKKA